MFTCYTHQLVPKLETEIQCRFLFYSFFLGFEYYLALIGIIIVFLYCMDKIIL